MLLNESLIIAYATQNYELKDNFLSSLKDLQIDNKNISLFIDKNLQEDGNVIANSNLWKQCKINKLKNLIDVLKKNYNNSKYKYFISSDCDIWFINENEKEWDNLQQYIDNMNKDIFFMAEGEDLDGRGGFSINNGFFIIKNNDNLIDIIIFLTNIYNKVSNINISDLPYLVYHHIFNDDKYNINFFYIPNDCCVWSYRIFNYDKALLHHPVCSETIDQKKEKIANIKRRFDKTKQSYNIVIAKYNENMEWTKYLNLNKVIIYDKSDNPIINSIPRPNIGRDPETFLYHIIQNYDNLPDHLIFIQGDPFPHFGDRSVNPVNFESKIYKLIDDNVNMLSLFRDMFSHHKNDYCGINITEYYPLLFAGPCPDHLIFASGCQYIVSKRNILVRPKKFYEYVYSLINNLIINQHEVAHYGNNIFNPNFMSVWCLERLLSYMFDGSTVLSDETKQKIYCNNI
jgi:hypothetical protein